MKFIDKIFGRSKPKEFVKCLNKKYSRSVELLLRETHKSCYKAAAIIALNKGYH